MLEFRAPEMSDKAWVQQIMEHSGDMACEYCFGNLYMWSAVYNNTIANYNGLFLARDGNENSMYIYPCGEGDKKSAIEELIRHAHATDGGPFKMYSLTPSKVRELDAMMPGKFQFYPMRDYFDYIYLTDDLIHLAGRKYHSKRNHIAYFKKTFAWSFEPIGEENIEACFAMNQKWEELNRQKNPEDIGDELVAIKRAFDKYFELDLTGGLLRANGEVVAYTIGERLNKKTFCTHIEKAFSDVRGAYPAINREFAANLLSGYQYINREEDTGSEGLRKAKQSYYPAILLPKYSAVYEGGI